MLFKFSISNNNSQELPVRNLINPLSREGLLYLRKLVFFIYVFVLYSLTLENKRHNIVFIKKSKNPMNEKKYNFSLK